ncbi:MAG: DUF664 domain-containing protein [Chloroflexi bacterium]|nr:DUF664 domain-containing protein [Chloroflexota bacterium]
MLPELVHYLQLLDDLRHQVRELIADLPADTLNWRPIADQDEHATNSLAVLAAHVAGAEHFWIAEVIGQRPATRDRDAEFRIAAADASDLLRRLDAGAAETAEVLSSLSETDLNGVRVARGREVTVRWGILHVIDHAALHLGHMQITYQLWKTGIRY